jgi:aminopeptidase N
LVRTARAELDVTGELTDVPELVGAPRPALVLLNDGDLTYCKVRFDGTSMEVLRKGLGDIADPLARALVWSAVWNLTRDGLLPARDYLDLVLRFAGRETDIGVLQSLHLQARTALDVYVDPERREAARRLLAEGAERELRAAPAGGDHQLAWARFFAQVAAAEDELALVRGLLEGTERVEGLDVDQELRWALWQPLAAAGAASADELTAELVRDNTASGRRLHTQCLAARPSAEAKAETWQRVVESDELPNALVDAEITGFQQAGQRDLLGRYAEPYFAALERVWAERSIEIAMRIVGGLFPRLITTPDTLARTDAWLAGHPDAAPALRRLVLEARDDLARSLSAQERDRGSAVS